LLGDVARMVYAFSLVCREIVSGVGSEGRNRGSSIVDDATVSGLVDSVQRSIGSMVDVSGRACGIVYGGGVTSRRMRARALRCIGDVG
jgi:hypothetical protein